MKLSTLFLLSYFLVNFCASSQAQFAQIRLPDEISLAEINEAKLNGVSFQLIKRKGWPGRFFKSTAFFISKNCLLTSAHNVKEVKSHLMYKMGIYPARRGTEMPFGEVVFYVDNTQHFKAIKRSFFNLKWRSRPHDMALIYIPDSNLTKNELMKSIDSLPIFENPQSLQKGDTIYCAGYPGTGVYSGQVVMTMISSTIKKIHKNHFSHELETLQGQSGSPIMVKRDGQFYVIGINSIHHYGTFLNEERQLLIKEWIKELEEKNK